jgi:crossover junction endodeoxyribonuclease RusA
VGGVVSTTFTLVPPAAFINLNDRLHHHVKARLTKAWREAARDAILTGFHPDHYTRARIVVAYRFPNNRRREVANLQPTSKAIVDGLVDANLLPDDSDNEVVGPDNRRHVPNGSPLVTVTITALEETP